MKDIAVATNMICRRHLSRLIQHHNHHHHAQKSCDTTIHLRRWISRKNTSNTYYDSQSGQHVPIHNENEVSVYLRGIGDCSTQQVIEMTKQYGCSGSILTLEQEMNDMPSISSNDNIYLHIKPELYLNNHQLGERKGSYNLCYEYEVGNDDDMMSTIKHMATDIQQDVSIGIFDSNIIMDEDPISVAANIANIIDCTSVSDENETAPYISNILIAPPTTTSTDNNTTTTIECCPDNLVHLCEELSYLDVPGPTIKSRLIVSTLNNNEEIIEECLQIGINKYILDISDDNMNDDLDDRLRGLKKVVEEEGKELILSDV